MSSGSLLAMAVAIVVTTMIYGRAGPAVKFPPQLRRSVRLPVTNGPPMGYLPRGR